MTSNRVRSLLLVSALGALIPACGSSDDAGTDAGRGAGGDGAGGGGNAGAGGDSVGGPPAYLEGEPPATLAHADAYDKMVALLSQATFTVDNLGDPVDFSASGATTPSAPTKLASLYFETETFHTSVQAVEDKRAGVPPMPDIGASLAQDFVQDLTLGAVSESPADARGGARFAGWHAVRTLDTYLLLRALQGLDERSGTGFDRALGLLWNAAGAPQGLGKRIADADAACGTQVLADLEAKLNEVRGPFAAALETRGELDPLDRKVIRVGDSPEYDAFVPQADRLLHEGLALSFVAGLRNTPLTALDQAQALAAYGALSPRVLALNPDGDTYVGQQLDQALPAQIDVAGMPGQPGIAGILTAAFGVTCAE